MTAETAKRSFDLAPVDPLDRVRARFIAWLAVRPGVARALRLSRLAAALVGLVLLVVLLIVQPLFGWMLLSALAAMLPFGVALLLTPTRTLGPLALLRVLGVAIAWAPAVAAICALAVAIAGLTPQNDGALVVIAGLGEESLKLLPFAIFAVLAPSRVRRLGYADLLLIGWCLGAGFTIVEEGLRAIFLSTSGGLMSAVARALDQVGPVATWNPLEFNRLGDGNGHTVWSTFVLGVVAVAIAWARKRRSTGRRSLRPLLFAIPVIALLLVAIDHGLQNSANSAGDLIASQGSQPLAAIAGVVWLVTVEGAALPFLVAGLWVWALASDALRRHRSADPAERPSSQATIDRILARPGGRPVIPVVLGAGAALALQIRDDALTAFAGIRAALRMPGRARFHGTIAAIGRPRAGREIAVAVAGEASGWLADRRRIRRSTIIWAAAVTPSALILMTVAAASVGRWLTREEPFWLFGIWDSLLEFWNGLPVWVQTAAILLAILTAWAYLPGMTLLGATQTVGWWMFGFTYGQAINAFIEDPTGTLKHYLMNTPPDQIGRDIIKLLLDYPGVNGTQAAEGIMQVLAQQRPDDYAVVLDEVRSVAQTTNSQQLTDFIDHVTGETRGGDQSLSDYLDETFPDSGPR